MCAGRRGLGGMPGVLLQAEKRTFDSTEASAIRLDRGLSQPMGILKAADARSIRSTVRHRHALWMNSLSTFWRHCGHLPSSFGPLRSFPASLATLPFLPRATRPRPRFFSVHSSIRALATHPAMSPSLESTASVPSSPESYGNFDLVRRVKLDFTDTIITKWRSRVTGLSVVHIGYDGKLPMPHRSWPSIADTPSKLPL